MANPTFLPHAFAEAALPANITVPVPDAPTGSNAASWQQGFPPITMTPKASGGQPPQGQDMNGVLNAMSAHTVFLQQGGVYAWDATVGAVGYPLGAVLVLNDGTNMVMNMLAANTADPNSDFAPNTHWWPVSGPMVGASTFAAAGGTANALTLTLPGSINLFLPHDVLTEGIRVAFRATAANTGACSLNVNGVGALLLQRSDNAPLAAGDLVVGQIYEAVHTTASGGWQLLTPVGSQIATISNARFGPVGNTYSGPGVGGMLGVGTTLAFTPSKSGNCLVTIAGVVFDTVTEPVVVQPRFGTGTAPANGAAVAGAPWSTGLGGYELAVTAGGAGTCFAFNDILSLAPGTAYWFDLDLPANTGQFNVTNAVFTIVEL